MKRETIEQQAESYTLAVFNELDDFSDATQAYIDGAEWMQEEMMDKACEWIIANMPNYVNFEDGLLYEVDMADDFRKAMEE